MVSAPLFKASVDTGIAISVWNGVHQQLRDAVSITLDKPAVVPDVVINPINLPKGPDLTPGQAEAANELGREFGADQAMLQWIKYLMGLLGSGISVEMAKNVLRCLHSKGEVPFGKNILQNSGCLPSGGV
jgi:hypothetical protein